MKATSSAAMRGKTARACDGCLKKRARWFCAADDAFLCHTCDSSVHMANQLASRHVRVRTHEPNNTESSPMLPWVTRKPRTPRHGKQNPPPPPPPRQQQQLVVPQMEEEPTHQDNNNNNEPDLSFRVPVFSDLCGGMNVDVDEDLNLMSGFLETFLAADEECAKIIKDEEQQQDEGEPGFIITHNFEESLMGWDFNFELPMVEEEEKKPSIRQANAEDSEIKEEMRQSNICLRLNHEAVIAAWAAHGSPWTGGSRPELNPDDYWLRCMGTNLGCRGEDGHSAREAKVSRYREKRRTRLFSKKIRYEVRKLNAEKRPRMKGRFVKRTLPPTTFASR